MIKWKRLGSSIVGNCKPLILHGTKQNLREKGRITQCKNTITTVRKYCPTSSYQSPRNCLATDCLTSYRYSLHYNFKVSPGICGLSPALPSTQHHDSPGICGLSQALPSTNHVSPGICGSPALLSASYCLLRGPKICCSSLLVSPVTLDLLGGKY